MYADDWICNTTGSGDAWQCLGEDVLSSPIDLPALIGDALDYPAIEKGSAEFYFLPDLTVNSTYIPELSGGLVRGASFFRVTIIILLLASSATTTIILGGTDLRCAPGL